MNGLNQLHARRSSYQVLLLLADIVTLEQGLDNGGTGGRTADAVFLQGVTQFVVVHQLTGGFHSTEQGGFGVGARGLRPFLHQLGHVGTALPFDKGRQHPVFIPILLIRLVSTFLLRGSIGREHHPPARIEYLPAGCLELHSVCLAHDRRGRETAVGIEHGDEAAGYEVEHPPFHIRQVDRRLSGRNDGVVVRDLRIVEHLLRFCQGSSLQRCGPGLIPPQPLQDGRTFGIDVIAQERGIYTRISRDLLLVERLDGLQRVVGRVGKLLVALHLQGGQVEKAERCFTPLLLRHGSNGERRVLDACQ